ncbi:MAG: hypothetical protein IJ817_01925 [Clostridia bacterium]|nr:hypothetical protein [Clostridia bacterium]
MRKLKTILFSILSIAIVAVFGFEVFAAVYINISIGGDVDYYASEIGAKVWGTYSYNPENVTGDATYLSLSGAGGTVSNNVYQISGEETDYSNITANIGTTHFSSATDTLTFYVFIKNIGDRYIIPTLSVSASDTTHMTNSTSSMFFDLSAGHSDPLTLKSNAASATAFVTSVETEIDGGNVSAFGSNSSIDNEDVWCGKVTISLQNVSGSGSIAVDSTFAIRVGFMADVQYTSNDILSVYQTQNQTATTWTKFGYNSTLSANATKVETNSLSNLYTYLDDADEYGNANITYGVDDYTSAVVYKDIDQVNVDIDTGEIIGKLSDVNYDFEWYGRPVTISAGTTLASGRTLLTDETFNVDVYTYYPDMYVRRWVVGDKQWLSVSDKPFSGAVKVDGYYLGTFEATLFSPVVDGNGNVTGYTAAYNSYGIIPRSYVYDRTPLTSGSANYNITNYGYGTYSGITNGTSQSQMISWSTNLTKKWAASGLDSQYRQVSGAQGENWRTYVWNMLYLIKYANNNSQATVGYGNTYTYSLYSANGVKVINKNGTEVTTGGSTSAYYEAEKGSGTIGVYNSSSKGTATYDSSNNYKMSATGYDQAGMNYGYNSTYTHGNDRQGLFANQFLTKSDGVTKHLLDGYVGSNRYTSVFCLGKCNPWGNIWKWIFGQAVVSDGTSLFSFISFDDYDSSNTGSSWYFTNTSGGYSTLKSILENRGYVELGYNLPTSNNYWRYFGTSIATAENPELMLIGMPTKSSSTASDSTGLSDYYYQNNTTAYTFGVLLGGYTYGATGAGAFCFVVDNYLSYTSVNIGFRPSLIS